MQFFRTFFLTGLFALMLIGCQGNNSDTPAGSGNDNNGTLPVIIDVNTTQIPTIVLPVTTAELTQSKQIVNIAVKVFDNANNPYQSGNVKIIYPEDVKTGRDIGYFQSSTVAVTNGTANFTYIGPADLTANTAPINFAFYHEDNPTESKQFTFTLNPDTNQTVLTNYTLTSVAGNSISMGLEQTQSLAYYVSDANGDKVLDSDMNYIKITLLNPELGTLIDQNNNSGDTLTFTGINDATLNLQTTTISGLLPIEVSAQFRDTNGDTQLITKIYNVIVLSGPPTAISMAYAGTSQDSQNAKFIESWIVTVTDKYNNLVNTEPSVSMGMLAGYTASSDATDNVAGYLYYNPATATNPASGTISATGGLGDGPSFTATNSPFANVDDINEYLVTFGNGYTYNASGKWSIQTDTNNKLSLVDDFNGTDVSNLGFAVGNNHRQDRCNFGDEWVGNVYAANNASKIGANGSLKMNVSYDYYLVGKDVMLWINLVGNSNGKTEKIGEAKKVTLRGMGLSGETYAYAKGYQGTVRLQISITNTVENYKNANFRYHVTVSGDDTNWTISGDSMDNGITSCIDNGVAYVDVTITGAGKAGTVSVTDVLPAQEF